MPSCRAVSYTHLKYLHQTSRSLPRVGYHKNCISGCIRRSGRKRQGYHLSEIFDDVRTLAEYDAGEIQLESLKLLPGTEMKRRADELGIQYSPLPPYEVLQTREITVDELQTAHYLSRLLDGFYNTPTWRSITRTVSYTHLKHTA